ncbi:MAG: hypothetical protein WCG22_07735, partial [Lentisphaerota bacterium]
EDVVDVFEGLFKHGHLLSNRSIRHTCLYLFRGTFRMRVSTDTRTAEKIARLTTGGKAEVSNGKS